MPRIDIKPLSVNKAYRGRRFATKELAEYKKQLNYLLPKLKIPEGKLRVEYIFGVSSKGGDGDNLIKVFQDCIAEKYGFNDNHIYKWLVSKVIVRKGREFISFTLSALN